MSVKKPPRTCYIAAAMSSVPEDMRPKLREKREAIATFFRDGYSIICSHYKVLYAEPESGPTSNPEDVNFVAHNLILVNAAEIFVMCFEGKKIFNWEAAIELGYAYGCGKPIVIFNLSDEDTYFFMKYLPQDAGHEVHIIENHDILKYFTEMYKSKSYSQKTMDEVREQLLRVLEKDAALSSMRPKLRKKRETIAIFLRGDSPFITCDVLCTEHESHNPGDDERVSIVARDLTLANVAEIVVMCFEGREIYSWGAAIELGYAYGCGKRIVIFNLSDEDTYFFMKYLPQDPEHQVYIVENHKSLMKFTQEYKPDGYSPEKVEEAREELEKVLGKLRRWDIATA